MPESICQPTLAGHLLNVDKHAQITLINVSHSLTAYQMESFSCKQRIKRKAMGLQGFFLTIFNKLVIK
jgi:hypothetical protein